MASSIPESSGIITSVINRSGVISREARNASTGRSNERTSNPFWRRIIPNVGATMDSSSTTNIRWHLCFSCFGPGITTAGSNIPRMNWLYCGGLSFGRGLVTIGQLQLSDHEVDPNNRFQSKALIEPAAAYIGRDRSPMNSISPLRSFAIASG